MKKLFLFAICGLLCNFSAISQELRCEISINSSQIQGTANKQIFDQLQKAIFEFMNQTKWTNETFSPQERIECTFFINVESQLSTDEFSGSIQVICSRPVYKSSYMTQIVNIEDDKFQFKFQQFSNLEFNINTFQNNLTSVLAFYAYVVIATDYDTFAPLGGSTYWQKAQQIANNAQTAREPGWSNSGTDVRTRWWLVENAMQPIFKGIRDCMYEYCRLGLDIMHATPEEGRAVILKSLDHLKEVAKSRPASYNMQQFFNAKQQEIIGIFKEANPEEKSKVIELLSVVDPAGTTKYAQILEGGGR
jgi:hypothetical protein